MSAAIRDAVVQRWLADRMATTAAMSEAEVAAMRLRDRDARREYGTEGWALAAEAELDRADLLDEVDRLLQLVADLLGPPDRAVVSLTKDSTKAEIEGGGWAQ